jgi:ABC-type phosphate/phosphonate transport system substrate-binding protein
MMRAWIGLIALGILGCSAQHDAPEEAVAYAPLRIALATGASGACAAPEAGAEPGALAYAAHLSARLERPVLYCPVADRTAAAALIAAGEADLALLDQATFPVAAASARPYLAPRGFSDRGRVETVAVVLAAGPRQSLRDVVGARFVFGGADWVSLEEPQRALRDHGISQEALAGAQTAADAPAAAAAVRGGQADIAVFYSAAWQRLCRRSAEDPDPCADLREVWRGRPTPESAWVIRTEIDLETRVRLVGVHIALHLENPEAFAWIAPGAPLLEPTEAGALAPAAL